MKQTLTLLLLWLGLLPSLPGCVSSFTYTAEPITAVVVDADTKKPLDGVVVVAHWQLITGTAGGSVDAGQLMVMEAVTGPDGKFTFPGFGPKTVWNRVLVHQDPELLLFKPGYEYQRLFNPYSSDWALRTRPMRRSVWDGKVIELRPFKGEVTEYAERFKDLNRELDSIISKEPEKCYWKKIPRMILAMMDQRLILEQKGVRYAYSIDQHLTINDEYFRTKGRLECGSPKDFINGLRP